MSFLASCRLDLSLPTTFLLISSIIYATTATLGTVSIDQLLLFPEHQEYGSSATRPTEKAKVPSLHTPWSRKPYCTSSTANSKKYCIYTSNATGANGLSLITTPKVATEAIQYLSEDPLSNFLTQEQAELLYYNAPPYKVVEQIDGKGKGVVATRLIKKFETFMVDQASVVMDLNMKDHMGKRENMHILREAVRRLKRPESVTGLSGRHGVVSVMEDDKGETHEDKSEEMKGGDASGKVEEDVMETNAFGTTVAGESFRGLFPLVAVSVQGEFITSKREEKGHLC
ncbi:hypothetical protein K504DRAFT_468366 [Pleomassaria siparia CBS 279.74]|uniref:Uncharacterized protein n=1 Tax=Pleomassaria siparia CBS 279.74 TaxID=1314801 RepID=A0A6G1K505_9PLEO|nr:hypothetical protein K504DRAFT_468366 [Pleomassaria siparia CBS 279.74]